MKRWPIIGLFILVLSTNQLLRSPFHIWNGIGSMKLAFSGFSQVVYERAEFNLSILEKKSTESERVVVVFPDIKSSLGFWRSTLESMSTDDTIRMIQWFGEGDSEWFEQSIVFTDLDLMLPTILMDNPEKVHIVAQGLGAWLAMRYQQQNPNKDVRVTAINPEGLSEAKPYPQSLYELDAVRETWIGKRWLPKFVRLDWLEWLDNPVKLAIYREMHVESVLEHSEAAENTMVIQTGPDGMQDWKNCPMELTLDCSGKLLKVAQLN